MNIRDNKFLITGGLQKLDMRLPGEAIQMVEPNTGQVSVFRKRVNNLSLPNVNYVSLKRLG